jgi:aminomethyltransferase
MDGHVNFTLSDRLRKSPYYEATLKAGAKTFTLYNHMIMPTSYEGAESDYWNLMNNVTMWDVAAERQVEIIGSDAYKFVEYITSRDLSKLQIGQGKYALITDENGGIINDPIILRLAENHFWLSIADSDVLLWTRGLACGLGWDLQISEPDVSPLAIQGPNNLPFRECELEGIPLIVQRSGWSKQGGFELYLRDGSQGQKLWDIIANAGKKYDIKPGTPNNIERVESGLFSWGNDMDINSNPLELPLDSFCQLDKEAEYLSRNALHKIRSEGITKKLVGLIIEGDAFIGGCASPWQVKSGKKICGKVTSAAYSPRLKINMAMATIDSGFNDIDSEVEIETPWGIRLGKVSSIPFN